VVDRAPAPGDVEVLHIAGVDLVEWRVLRAAGLAGVAAPFASGRTVLREGGRRTEKDGAKEARGGQGYPDSRLGRTPIVTSKEPNGAILSCGRGNAERWLWSVCDSRTHLPGGLSPPRSRGRLLPPPSSSTPGPVDGEHRAERGRFAAEIHVPLHRAAPSPSPDPTSGCVLRAGSEHPQNGHLSGPVPSSSM